MERLQVNRTNLFNNEESANWTETYNQVESGYHQETDIINPETNNEKYTRII